MSKVLKRKLKDKNAGTIKRIKSTTTDSKSVKKIDAKDNLDLSVQNQVPKVNLPLDALTLPRTMWQAYFAYNNTLHVMQTVEANGLNIVLHDRLDSLKKLNKPNKLNKLDKDELEIVNYYNELINTFCWRHQFMDYDEWPGMLWSEDDKRAMLRKWLTNVQRMKLKLLLSFDALKCKSFSSFDEFKTNFESSGTYVSHELYLNLQDKQQALTQIQERINNCKTVQSCEYLKNTLQRDILLAECEDLQALCSDHIVFNKDDLDNICLYVYKHMTKEQQLTVRRDYETHQEEIKKRRRDKLKMSTAHRSLHTLVPLLAPGDIGSYFGSAEYPNKYCEVVRIVSAKQTTVQVEKFSLKSEAPMRVAPWGAYDVDEAPYSLVLSTAKTLSSNASNVSNDEKGKCSSNQVVLSNATPFSNICATTNQILVPINNSSKIRYISMRVIRNEEHLRTALIFLMVCCSETYTLSNVGVTNSTAKENELVKLISTVKQKRLAKHDNRNALYCVATIISNYVSHEKLSHLRMGTMIFEKIPDIHQWLNSKPHHYY